MLCLSIGFLFFCFFVVGSDCCYLYCLGFFELPGTSYTFLHIGNFTAILLQIFLILILSFCFIYVYGLWLQLFKFSLSSRYSLLFFSFKSGKFLLLYLSNSLILSQIQYTNEIIKIFFIFITIFLFVTYPFNSFLKFPPLNLHYPFIFFLLSALSIKAISLLIIFILKLSVW